MRILLPVDGSSFSKAAVSFIASRDTLIQSRPRVELLNMQYRIPPPAARALGKESVVAYQAAEADLVLKPALARLHRAGLTAHARYVVGTVSDELASIMGADKADLIVMGSHGHTGLKRLLFGSVASTVLASCTTPLLLLRGKPAPRKDSLRLGIALDGSKYGIAAVRFVIKHRALFGVTPTVELIHVVPDLLNLVAPGYFRRVPATGLQPEQVEAMQAAAFEATMAPARKLLQNTGIAFTEVRLVGNTPGEQIATHATQRKFDVLVLGTHGRGALESTLLGSVATRTAALSRVPLLFIRKT